MSNVMELAQFIRYGELIVNRLRADEQAAPELVAKAEMMLDQAKDALAVRVLAS